MSEIIIPDGQEFLAGKEEERQQDRKYAADVVEMVLKSGESMAEALAQKVYDFAQSQRNVVGWRRYAVRMEKLLEVHEKGPTKETLTRALEDALFIIERCVDPAKFECNTGPDADGDDANAAALISLLRSLNVTLEAAQGKDGPATKVAKALGELT